MESVAGMKKGTFLSCLVPRSPPLTQLSTLRCGKAKQTAVQTPQIITQESHWERCVGSGCVSMSAPVFTDIHLHMSRPQLIRSHECGFGFGFGGNKYMQLPVVAACYTIIIIPDKIVSPQTEFIYIPNQISSHFARFAPCTVI